MGISGWLFLAVKVTLEFPVKMPEALFLFAPDGAIEASRTYTPLHDG